MSNFKIYKTDDAPEASKGLLEVAEKGFGFVPNILGVMAESPATLKSYMDINGNLEEGNLSKKELQVALLSVSNANGCTYCQAAHGGLAKMVGVPEGEIKNILSGKSLDDVKLNHVSDFVRTLVKKQGSVDSSVVENMRSQGFSNAHILELVAVVSMKTLSNYVNHLASTPIDEQFK